MADVITVPLRCHASVKGAPVSDLLLRRPVAADLIAAEQHKSMDGFATAVLAEVLGVTVSDIDLDDYDWQAALMALDPHLNPDESVAKSAPEDADGSITLRLKVPFVSLGAEVDHLTIRRSRTRNRLERDAVTGNLAKDLRQIASCSGTSPADLMQMSAGDFMTATKVLERFLSSPPSSTASQ